MQEASVMLEELKKLTSETTSSGFSTFFKEKFGSKVEEMKEYASRKTGFANLDSEFNWEAGHISRQDWKTADYREFNTQRTTESN